MRNINKRINKAVDISNGQALTWDGKVIPWTEIERRMKSLYNNSDLMKEILVVRAMARMEALRKEKAEGR